MKLVVFFPGIGYHCDKPLLYYSKKLAAQYGFAITEVPYSGFQKDIKGSKEKMYEAFESALMQAEHMLEHVIFEEYDTVLFVSKSIGTAVAGAYDGRHCVNAYHIFYTPVEESLAVMRNGIAFHGTADPWADAEMVWQGCMEKELPCFSYETANHSLETGDVQKDLENLQDIMKKTEAFIRNTGEKRAKQEKPEK